MKKISYALLMVSALFLSANSMASLKSVKDLSSKAKEETSKVETDVQSQAKQVEADTKEKAKDQAAKVEEKAQASATKGKDKLNKLKK